MKKKLISLLLAGGMILSMAACGNSEQGDSQSQTGGTENSAAGSSETSGSEGSEASGSGEAAAPADDFTYPMEPVTFTFNGSGSGGTDYYDDNEHPAWAKDIYIHKVMRDMTGVSLTDIGGAAGSTTMSEQFLLMLASGELPDIINAPWNAYTGGAAAAIEEGYIVDMMEYTDCIPNLLNYLDENPEIAAQVLTPDGKLGFAPFIKANPIPEMGLVIRKDWLDELNLEAPTTIDEMHDVLVAFKEKYNCKSPLTFEARWLFQQGSANPLSSPWKTTYQEYILDGKVQFGPLTEEYREFIATLAQWYKEGLLDPDFASVDKSTVQAKFSNGEAGVSIQQSSNIQNCLSANEGTGYEVLALESLVMNKGDEPEFAQQSIQHYDGGMCYAVSTTCPDIEAACRYLDWRFSEEGLMTMNYGIEGVTYEVVNGEVQLTDLILHNEETPVANSARDEIAQNRNRAGVSLDISLAYTDEQKEWIDVWTAHMDEYVLPTVPYTAEQQDIIGKNWGNVDDYCQEMILKYIVGSSDISEWDTLVKTIQGMEIDKVLAAKQEAYDNYLQRVEELKK
ncbi:MAG: extracellular solute-binding protein [Acetatifactor sp.]|nr:extracellular solute-binding protein [Acetatifactor sp.]